MLYMYAQARATLAAIVDALPPGVFFNIYGFGSTHVKLFAKSVAKTDASAGKVGARVAAS